MLKFVSAYLALSYLAFSALAVAGLLQVLASWGPYVGLALLDYRQRSTWRRALGPLLIVVAYGWFFGTRREILSPGPAGAELTVLFGAGVLLAVGFCTVGASIARSREAGLQDVSLPASLQVQDVPLCQGLGGLLFSSTEQAAPSPAVCLVADPSSGRRQWQELVEALLSEGFVVLVPSWGPAFQRYPDALAMVPAAMSFLSRHPLVDGSRLAAGGIGLGGDLALRAAASDRQIKAVFALAPLLQPQNAVAGLGLLREMTYPEALAWRLEGRRRELVGLLDAISATGEGDHQPALVVYGGRDGVVRVPEVEARLLEAGANTELRTVAGEGHLSLAASPEARVAVRRWLAEHLAAVPVELATARAGPAAGAARPEGG